MTRALRPATGADVQAIERALKDVRSARANLRRAGAVQAARYLARAIKSVEGALRHAYRREARVWLAEHPMRTNTNGGAR